MRSNRDERRRRALGAAAGIIAFAAVAAHADPSVSVSRVSSESPYAPGFCGTDPIEHGYETDPSFAVAPQGLVAAWEQDTWNKTPGAVVGHSSDGGLTWTQSVPSSAAMCQSGAASSLSIDVAEPALAVDGLGTTFMLVLVGEGSFPQMSVSSSRDGGATWSPPTNFENGPFGRLTSGPTISADPTDPRAVAFIWVSHEPPDAIWFARTADDGATWSTPRPISLAPPGMIFPGAAIVTLPSGTLLVAATEFSYLDVPSAPQFGLPNANVIGIPHDVRAVRSTDHGATWSETPIASLSANGGGVSEPAIGPDGSVYELIVDVEASNRVWKVLRSADDGVSWSEAARVPVPADASAPAFAVSGDGTIGVLYDDQRNDAPDDQPLTTDVWLTVSRDGGQTWSDVHLGGPFDLSALPSGLGDYQTLRPLGDGLAAVFLLGPCTATPSDSCPATTEGPSDVYFARITF